MRWLRILAVVFTTSACAEKDSWPHYGGDLGSTRYSSLTQITPTNVAQLKPAWVFHTGDISPGDSDTPRSGFESTPLLP